MAPTSLALLAILTPALVGLVGSSGAGGDSRPGGLASLADIQSEPYERVHELVVQHQIEAYKKPLESLQTRSVQSLNGLWDFCFDPAGEGHKSRWFERPIRAECEPSNNYYKMPVPSAFNELPSNRSAKNYVGWMWYQTSWSWPGASVRGVAIDRVSYEDADANTNTNANADADDEHDGDGQEPVAAWILQLESVDYLAVVWLQVVHANGTRASHQLGAHAGGNLPITLDVSDLLNGLPDSRALLRLTLAVSNQLTRDTIPSGRLLNETESVGRPYFRFVPDFDFFHFAGITGDVGLVKLAPTYLADAQFLGWRQRRARERLDAEPSIRVSLNEAQPLARRRRRRQPRVRRVCFERVRCQQVQHWPDGNAAPICQEFTGAREVVLTNLPPPPASQGAELDLVRLTLERRSGVARAETRWLLEDVLELAEPNGRQWWRSNMSAPPLASPATLQGFGMHQEQLFSGRTMSLAAIVKDLQLVRGMGANVLRTSHYPYSRAYLDACDQLGLMVIAEAPAVGLNSFSALKLQLHKQLLREMMQRDHRHGSIIMWSLANEPESQLPEARAYFTQLVDFARTQLKRFTLDAGRPLTAAIAQSHRDDTIGHLFDVLMVNRYYGWYDCPGLVECVRASLLASLRGWARKHPDKPLLLSEFGADTLAGLHSSTGELFSEEYQRDLLVEYERVFDELIRTQAPQSNNATSASERINFVGSMIWNFADFSTHGSLMRPGGNRKGVFTRWREPKLAAESIRRIYTGRKRALAQAQGGWL